MKKKSLSKRAKLNLSRNVLRNIGGGEARPADENLQYSYTRCYTVCITECC